MKAYLNGILLDSNSANLDSIEIDFKENKVKDYADQVEFTGWAWDLIKTELINNPKGYLKSIPFYVQEDCCGESIPFTGRVSGDRIEWDSEGCKVTASILQDDSISESIRKIKSTLISEDLPTDNPVLFVFSGRNIIQIAFNIWLYGILSVIFLFLTPLVAVLGLLKALISFDLTEFDATLAQYEQFRAALADNVRNAAGQNVPTVLVRDILSNTSALCGLVFESPIFTDSGSPYYNLGYLSIQQSRYAFNDTVLKSENIPVRSLFQFLEELKLVFNGDWIVQDGKLIFDRRDSLPITAAFDISQESDLFINFQWKPDIKKAYFDLQYSLDIDEKGGNAELNGFNHIEEWNAASNQTQEGVFEVSLPFSSYVLDLPFNTAAFRNLINIVLNQIGVPIPAGKHLEISGNYVYVPKLLPLEKNGPNWIVSDNDSMKGATLYNSFYSIEDPNVSNYRGLDFSATFNGSCDFKALAPGLSYIELPIDNTKAFAYVNSIKVNYSSNTIQISGDL